MSRTLYDDIGRTYTATRRTDPRIAAAIDRALGDARTVLNVGAGTGSYEPAGRAVTAVEPSPVMIAQRPTEAAPVVRANAEALPFEDASFDATMAVLSDHHWRDRRQGLRELLRVARHRVVVLQADPGEFHRFWFTREYLPEFLDVVPERYRAPGVWKRDMLEMFLGAQLIPVPIPHDCRDGFYGAFWRRPAAYLDPHVRAGISVFSNVAPEHTAWAVAALREDLSSGAWERRHSDLLELDELDLGYYLVVCELDRPAR